MEKVVPWRAMEALIEPYYPRSGRRGLPPSGLSTMLRVHFLQQRYGYGNRAADDAFRADESVDESTNRIGESGAVAPKARQQPRKTAGNQNNRQK
jgi:hypothetical protein